MSEDSHRSRIVRIRVLVLASFAATASAHAQTWRITPSIAVIETLTDNVALAPDNAKQSDLITQIVPGIRIDGASARARLNLNYRMNNILYAHEAGNNNIQHFLSANGSIEPIKNWFFVDGSAVISQEAFSAFGALPATTGDVHINNNRVETRSFQISPYIRGHLGSTTTQYQLRYRYTQTSTRGSQLPDASVDEWLGFLNGATSIANLGWRVDATNQQFHQNTARDTEVSRVRGSLIYQYDPQLRFTGVVGYEQNDYSGPTQSGTIYGGGVEWSPTTRTHASAYYENRTFGDYHSVTIQHRTRLTAWRYTDARDVTTLPNQLALVRAGTAFDLLFDALSSRFPDPVERRQEVERQLQVTGIPADLVLPRTVLTTRVFLNRSRIASVALLGSRNTVTLAASFQDNEAVTPNIATDDFARSSAIHQRGLTANWSHRLTAISSVSLLASHIRTSSDAPGIESSQAAVRLMYSRQLGPRSSGSVSARFVSFNGVGASDFHEKALVASFFHTF